MNDRSVSQPDAGLPARARVVVVGGGVVGSSVAYHLAHLGVTDVVLVERHELTAGTTWHAAGLITSAGMTDETSIWMARYSRDLYTRLEAETGHSTGFREIGHLHLACNPGRLETLRRERAFQRGFGIDNVEVSPAEVAQLTPVTRVDDVLAASYVADEGRADPVGVATALAKGARQLGVRVVTGTSVTGLRSERGRVTAVVTDRGDVECETVVLAAGLWTRELGRRCGVDVPLQAAEHYYLLTEPVPGVHRDLPVVEDPDRYGYYREEADGLLVGLFEPVGAAWHLDAPPADFAFGTIPPDWDRMTPFLERAMWRYPGLEGIGLRKLFCGPESFTADVHPLLGPAPEVEGVFVAAGMNSLGILSGGGAGSVVAQWIVDGRPPVDVTHYSVERALPHETTRRFRGERVVEALGVLFGDGVWPTFQWRSGRGVRRSVLHDRLAAAGARFGQSAGWEYPLWFGDPGTTSAPEATWGRAASFPRVAEEHRAVREAVGVMDMSLMSKFLVQGPDAGGVLNRLSVSQVDGEPGRVVYTQWCQDDGGLLADLTVTKLADERFLVVASDVVHRRVETMLRRAPAPGEVAISTDVTAGTTLLSVQGPASRELLASLSPDDWSDAAFPYLTAREVEVGSSRFLALRVTYLGELGYELHVPADQAASVYDALVAAGAPYGLRDVGLLAMGSLRLEKGYRDYGVDIENTDDPLVAGLGFTIAWDKPGGFTGRDALLARRDDRRARMVHVRVDDPEPLLHGGEPVLHHGTWVGYVRAGDFGHTLGTSVGLAVVEHDEGVTPDWLRAGGFEVDVAGTRHPATLSLRPFYDPTRERILG
ncbi:FAD-dependent oxidoreductase [Nocardioides taihuensis]|uniref:FAD-dependent oxidoreductase n=1 Tax=Nocardioides taihuensis TaxID=1835606 RepID=A0ABW0BDF7_9ACTN